MKTSTHGDRYEDDGTIFFMRDYEGKGIRLNIGPVYEGNRAHPELALWFNMEEDYFLMSQETFFQMCDFVHRRTDEWKKFQQQMSEA